MNDTDYRDAKWLPALAFAAALGRRVIRSIILHSSPATAKQLADRSPDNQPTSVHYHVSPRGAVTQHIRESAIAFHMAGTTRPQHSDAHTIGIVLERNGDEGAWPDPQILAVARLVAAIRVRHPDLPVHTHAEVTRPASRIDDPRDWPMLEMEVCVQRILDAASDLPPLPC